ncbi:MAG: hypothetical protein V2I32_09370, partial [Desulforhopalus sp.]|nr:hypothetical protein [Desulforhopalus sp.]
MSGLFNSEAALADQIRLLLDFLDKRLPMVGIAGITPSGKIIATAPATELPATLITPLPDNVPGQDSDLRCR